MSEGRFSTTYKITSFRIFVRNGHTSVLQTPEKTRMRKNPEDSMSTTDVGPLLLYIDSDRGRNQGQGDTEGDRRHIGHWSPRLLEFATSAAAAIPDNFSE